MNTAVYMILRSVRLDAVLNEGSGMTVWPAILGYYALDEELMERYFAASSAPEFSLMSAIAKYVMKGWRAVLWSRKIDIPEPAKPYIQNLGEGHEMLRDVPINLIVAHIPNFENSSLDD
ncbi:hypothetical protein F4680DRAFT_25320 [Xylaria scruposa]|nr:hypothetical protein F4680DRAFT_25320 [Xylaria scruposa]